MLDTATYLTPDGHEKLRHELDELIHVKRKEIANRIQEAKELGDLSENAEYQGAREEQAFNEGRIEEIEATLRTAVIINDRHSTKGAIQVGSSVTISMAGKESTVQIVGSNEADPTGGFVSNVSPLGQALIGQTAGQTVTVKAPKGEISVTVVKVA